MLFESAPSCHDEGACYRVHHRGIDHSIGTVMEVSPEGLAIHLDSKCAQDLVP